MAGQPSGAGIAPAGFLRPCPAARLGRPPFFDTIKTLTANGRHINGDLPGFFGALHTWGSQLQYHPHIHYVVAGGAYCNTTDNWTPSRIDFLLPVRAMSKLFKAKFADLMRACALYDQIPEQLWQQGFNVDCRPVGSDP